MRTMRSALRWLHPKRCMSSGTNSRSLRRPQTFFATTACSIALSRLRSATICLSRIEPYLESKSAVCFAAKDFAAH